LSPPHARGRGSKPLAPEVEIAAPSRPLTGARIETRSLQRLGASSTVAPSRGRGSKLRPCDDVAVGSGGRPLTGARIETFPASALCRGRSVTGVSTGITYRHARSDDRWLVPTKQYLGDIHCHRYPPVKTGWPWSRRWQHPSVEAQDRCGEFVESPAAKLDRIEQVEAMAERWLAEKRKTAHAAVTPNDT
jgi:hypothetical protein